MEQEISNLIILWTLCGLTCHQCSLKCVKNRDHEEDHDCLTDHKCNFICHFTDGHNKIMICSHEAGHEDKHVCSEISHSNGSCGQLCNLVDKRNCLRVCLKEIGHNGEHLCQSSRHYCGKTCSLSIMTQKGEYRCLNKCIMPYEVEHDLHHCENETCPIQCPISDCQRKCQSNEHFHAYSNSQVDHFGGNEHQCRELCEDDGICKYIQLSERLSCDKRIPPNDFKHTGKNSHGDEYSFHFVIAHYPMDSQKHNTTHGNMIRTEFTSENKELKYAGYFGVQGEDVLCNLFCKDLGRHRHISYCQSQDICQGQDIQHINEQVQPNPSKPFLTNYPYSAQEQQEFTKCDHECPNKKHHKSKRSASRSLTIFHAQLDPNSNPRNDIGYISKDGHHFNCENLSPCVSIYECTYEFCSNKSTSSHILFNHEVIVPFEYQDLKDPKNLLDKMIEHQPCGLKNFELAIQKAGSLISSHYDSTRTNIIIFLSDGECDTPKRQLHDICKENQTRGSPLYFYTVLFSSVSNNFSLKEMTTIAQSYHTKSTSSSSLRCQFTHSTDKVHLVKYFTSVAKSLI
ncbi:8001_t:CDS:10 [Funneliformis caledonium]|uniref:8001_t:CDS:1 n=1 Tax=Funneliformis caledonium TaxID=1117310 RepID=A0A9N9HV52_9GLOM|nr:8001_t:CDS:10 [Funneliformis caledonium]